MRLPAASDIEGAWTTTKPPAASSVSSMGCAGGPLPPLGGGADALAIAPTPRASAWPVSIGLICYG